MADNAAALVRESPQRGPRTGRKPGATNFTLTEFNFLLRILAVVLPLGRNHWIEVAAQHNREGARLCNSWPERTDDSCKRKFFRTVQTHKPTGVATMPEHVRVAKEIWEEIKRKSAISETRQVSDGESEPEDEGIPRDENAAPRNARPAQLEENPEQVQVNKRRSRVDGAMFALAEVSMKTNCIFFLVS